MSEERDKKVEEMVEIINESFGADAAYFGVDPWGLADHLLANGVTIQKHGRWELYPSSMHRRCSVCKVEYEKPRFNVRANFCPNCGAKMDIERRK